MAKKQCPACKKSMEGQVVMCPLCGETYHKACFQGSWDCVFCTTQISGKKTRKIKRKISPIFYVIFIVIFMALTLVVVLKFVIPLHEPATPLQVTNGEINTQIDLFRIALYQYEKKNGPLRGTSLSPLSGGFLSTIPMDPWKRPYIYDGDLGIIATFGADGKEGGKVNDLDSVCYFRKRLHLVKAEKSSPLDELTLYFNKPCIILDDAKFLSELRISNGSESAAFGLEDWVVNTESKNHAPEKGQIVLKFNKSELFKDKVYVNFRSLKIMEGIAASAANRASKLLRAPMAVTVPPQGVLINLL